MIEYLKSIRKRTSSGQGDSHIELVVEASAEDAVVHGFAMDRPGDRIVPLQLGNIIRNKKVHTKLTLMIVAFEVVP